MKPLRIAYLRWDDWNVEHIAEHSVEVEEVEWVCRSMASWMRHAGTTGHGLSRYYVYGQTESGRYLFVVLDREVEQLFYTVTARDMTDNERKGYKRQRGGR
ncbi:MAG: hypothetical protein NT169_18365 [Chloroflexi bacterium]|nr:hypothetical protein [Chloroflexota bacterium]